MRIVAHRGNRLHAPENTRTALISAYTAGADALEFGVQLTKDDRLVVSQDATLARVAGEGGPIVETELDELRKLDVSETFSPRGAKDYSYRKRGRVAVETFPELLDALPADVPKLIELKHDSTLDTGRRDELVEGALGAVLERKLVEEVIVYSTDPETLRAARERAPYLRICAFDWARSPAEQVDLMEELHADGVVIELDAILGGGQLNEIGERLAKLHSERDFRVGAVVYLHRDEPVFTEKEYRTLRKYNLVWGLATDSVLDVAPFARATIPYADESFAGKQVDTDRFAFGYATSNRYARVFQDDGVHVKIEEFDQDLTPPGDAVERRLAELEERLWHSEKSWPFYSGGGVGLVQGVEGDFAAEVDYEVSRVGQATTLEMAVVNVDPGAHEPTSNQDGGRLHAATDGFFDPHGAPPFAGVEHDEDDGYRINWNLGAEHDSNRYGRPCGDGSALKGRLRLERRGPWFSAYYRNDDAPDWVCAGVARNDSLNLRVFLRCAGKRWRQRREDDPSEYYPVAAVEFVFSNLKVERFPAWDPGR
jgi:glycerophosphoryl diester phosphodiesterase